MGVRCPVASEVYDLVQRVLPCLEAAALATGCDYEIKRQALYMDTQQSSGLTDYLRQVSKAKWDLDAPDMPTTAATDFVSLRGVWWKRGLIVQGLITYTMPALHPMFNLPEAKAGDFPRELSSGLEARTARSSQTRTRSPTAPPQSQPPMRRSKQPLPSPLWGRASSWTGTGQTL